MVDVFMEEAINQAKIGLSEGGIPIGSVLVIDGKIVGKGHNKRIQKKKSNPSRRNGLSEKCRKIIS